MSIFHKNNSQDTTGPTPDDGQRDDKERLVTRFSKDEPEQSRLAAWAAAHKTLAAFLAVLMVIGCWGVWATLTLPNKPAKPTAPAASSSMPRLARPKDSATQDGSTDPFTPGWKGDDDTPLTPGLVIRQAKIVSNDWSTLLNVKLERLKLTVGQLRTSVEADHYKLPQREDALTDAVQAALHAKASDTNVDLTRLQYNLAGAWIDYKATVWKLASHYNLEYLAAWRNRYRDAMIIIDQHQQELPDECGAFLYTASDTTMYNKFGDGGDTRQAYDAIDAYYAMIDRTYTSCMTHLSASQQSLFPQGYLK